MYLSQEVVREFEVVTSGGGAEFGRASSGTISVVTQSGTNQIARTGLRVLPQRPLRRAEPAGDPEGSAEPEPVRADPRRTDRPRPDVLVRQRRAHAAGSHRHRHDRAGIGERGQRRARCVRLSRSANQHGQLSHRLHRGQRVPPRRSSGGVRPAPAGALQRLPRDAARTRATSSGLSDVSRGAALDDTDQTVAASLLTSRSSSTINELRAQYTHSRLGAPVNDIIGPSVTIAGVANFGTATSSPTGRDTDVIQAIDTVTMQHGSHLVKSGRRSALQPHQHHVPGRAAGQLHLHLAGELSARHLLAVSAGVRRAVAAAVEPEPRRCSRRTNGGRATI